MPTYTWLPLSSVIGSAYQPRLQRDHELTELADCIQLNGLLVPLIVMPSPGSSAGAEAASAGDAYLMISGHRRRSALLILQKRQASTTLPPGCARIVDGEVQVQVKLDDTVSQKDAAFFALLENVRRKGLTQYEKANAYKVLVEQGKMTRKELADRMQEQGDTIDYMIGALDPKNLAQEMIDAWSDNRLTMGHIKVLYRLRRKPTQQKQLFTQILKAELTVSDARMRCNHLLGKGELPLEHREYDLFEKSCLAHPALRQAIDDDDVNLKRSRKGERIEINFDSADDLRQKIAYLQEVLKSFPL